MLQGLEVTPQVYFHPNPILQLDNIPGFTRVLWDDSIIG